jgi:hypothetical protein
MGQAIDNSVTEELETLAVSSVIAIHTGLLLTGTV